MTWGPTLRTARALRTSAVGGGAATPRGAYLLQMGALGGK
jgi:hypothetical protein